jgi:M6 family metalloprotease-like protein
MLNKILFLTITLGLNILLASTPAKPGVTPSEKVKQFTQIMGLEYQRGGLVAKMQRIREANIQHAENGTRDLREDVYMSFPVILGSYANANDPGGTASALQSELFDGPWPTITMAEHYEEMSYGQFHLSGGVYGWYELSENAAYYEGSQSQPYDNGFTSPPGGVGSFLQEALDLADMDIDFTQYDNDGPDGIANSGDDDGVVDAAFFVHSGPGGEGGGPSIWSHRWNYSAMWGTAYATNDTGVSGSPIVVDDYIMQPAESTNGGLIEIGVFSHEFGHAIGLPDLYDTDYSSDGIGNWCLMAGGSWTTPSSPAHMSAWCKEMMGWVIPVMPDANDENFPIAAVVESGDVLKVWTEGVVNPFTSWFGLGLSVGREYFLIENRQILGSDQHLEGTGLMIYHVDNSVGHNSNDAHRMVDIRAANGFNGGTNPGHPWPGTSNNRTFDFETIPSSMSWAGTNSQVAILNISDSDSIMSVSVEVVEAYPHLYIEDFTYSDENDDGFLSPGESGQIWIDLVNYGVLTTGITASVIPGNTAFNFTNADISFEDIAVNSSATSTTALEFTMASNFETGTSTLQLQVNNSTSDIIDTLSFELIIGDPQFAIVDADGAVSGDLDVQEYYTQALIDNDIVYTLWDIAIDGLPTEDWLSGRPHVIYFTGSAGLPLTAPVIDLLTSYQDGGGKLLLTGQDLTDGDEVQAAFLNEYCAVDFVAEETVNPRYLFGNPDHEMMTEADQYRINTIYGANNQTSPDVVARLSHGSKLFQYPRLDDQAAGVTTIQNGYKTIFLAFGFEAIAGLEDEGPEIRSDLMQRFLEWFDIDYVGVESEDLVHGMTPRITSLFPNPFNPSVKVNYDLPERMDVSMIVYDIAGREVARLAQGEQAAGHHQVQWNGEDSSGNPVSTGVYFCRLKAGEISQTMKMVYLK